MSAPQTLETEEDLLTCLRVRLYHPQQSSRGLYGLLPLGRRVRHPADEPLRLGRDAQACALALADPRVSRRQLALQAYRAPRGADMLFAIQNLSQRGRLAVNGAALGHLERTELPDEALVRFGEYEALITREPGEARASFEVELEVLAVAPSGESRPCGAVATPVPETGAGLPAELRAHGPLETDETLMCLA